MDKLFFDGWETIARTLINGSLAYVGLVIMLRIAGNRTLAQLNAFDFVVTVALGSTLASIILSKDVSLAQGLTGLGLLILLQYVLTALSVRSSKIKRFITTEPLLLYYEGKYLEKALRKYRVTRNEIIQVIRANGTANLEEVEAVVLETNGKFSVLKKKSAKASSMQTVRGAEI